MLFDNTVGSCVLGFASEGRSRLGHLRCLELLHVYYFTFEGDKIVANGFNHVLNRVLGNVELKYSSTELLIGIN